MGEISQKVEVGQSTGRGVGVRPKVRFILEIVEGFDEDVKSHFLGFHDFISELIIEKF